MAYLTHDADLAAHVRARVSKTVDEMLASSDAARGLAGHLLALAEVSPVADADELRDTAAGLRAIAHELVLSGAALVGVSERMLAYAGMREVIDAPT